MALDAVEFRMSLIEGQASDGVNEGLDAPGRMASDAITLQPGEGAAAAMAAGTCQLRMVRLEGPS